jgi:hypothetical protein
MQCNDERRTGNNFFNYEIKKKCKYLSRINQGDNKKILLQRTIVSLTLCIGFFSVHKILAKEEYLQNNL